MIFTGRSTVRRGPCWWEQRRDPYGRPLSGCCTCEVLFKDGETVVFVDTPRHDEPPPWWGKGTGWGWGAIYHEACLGVVRN